MARMAPVLGAMTTTVQSRACILATCCWQACCAASCSAGMIVSVISLPSVAGVTEPPSNGMCSPLVPT